jgi:hypothetical protein
MLIDNEVRLVLMEVVGRVVMSNAATMRQLYTRGDNEALC